MSTKVATLAELPGFRAWEFRARDWVDPFPHHVWCEITDPELVAHYRRLLVGEWADWWIGGRHLSYDISYHAVLRPMLVCIAGIR